MMIVCVPLFLYGCFFRFLEWGMYGGNCKFPFVGIILVKTKTGRFKIIQVIWMPQFAETKGFMFLVMSCMSLASSHIYHAHRVR